MKRIVQVRGIIPLCALVILLMAGCVRFIRQADTESPPRIVRHIEIHRQPPLAADRADATSGYQVSLLPKPRVDNPLPAAAPREPMLILSETAEPEPLPASAVEDYVYEFSEPVVSLPPSGGIALQVVAESPQEEDDTAAPGGRVGGAVPGVRTAPSATQPTDGQQQPPATPTGTPTPSPSPTPAPAVLVTPNPQPAETNFVPRR